MSSSSDVGYRVSSQLAEGLCVCAQIPMAYTADFKRCGLDSLMYKYKLSLALTHTYIYSQTQISHTFFTHPHELGHGFYTHSFFTNTQTCARLPLLPNRNTQGAVSWMLGLEFGWREAWLSTPVFAAAIRGTFYFRAVSIRCYTYTL